MLIVLSKGWKSLVKQCNDCRPKKLKILHSVTFRGIVQSDLVLTNRPSFGRVSR